VLVPKAKHN